MIYCGGDSATVIIGYCDYLGTRAEVSQYPINTLTSSHKALAAVLKLALGIGKIVTIPTIPIKFINK